MGSLSRPDPILDPGSLAPVDKKSDLSAVAEGLRRGERFLVRDLFSTGLSVLAELRRSLGESPEGSSYSESRAWRAKYREASQGLLVPIKAGKVDLGKSPAIGWLGELYPEYDEFSLPFPQVQGLNSSWQWFVKGFRPPVLKRTLHPFYGTYFPSRFEHLELFSEWLAEYRGARNLAIDVGTGCGVLAFQLDEAGWPSVDAVDSNPNAVESVRRDLSRKPASGEIRVAEGDLFPEREEAADLIVFNPPWVPGEIRNPLDLAMYYPADLFPRFFEKASVRLKPEGRLVLLFSNLLREADGSARHPVLRELEEGKRFALESKLEKGVRASSSKTKRRKRSTSKERVELWELKRA